MSPHDEAMEEALLRAMLATHEKRPGDVVDRCREELSGALGRLGSELDVPRRNRPAGSTEGGCVEIEARTSRLSSVTGRGRLQLEKEGIGRSRPLSDECEMERGAGIVFGVLLGAICWLAILASGCWFWRATQ